MTNRPEVDGERAHGFQFVEPTDTEISRVNRLRKDSRLKFTGRSSLVKMCIRDRVFKTAKHIVGKIIMLPFCSSSVLFARLQRSSF